MVGSRASTTLMLKKACNTIREVTPQARKRPKLSRERRPAERQRTMCEICH